jgi:hypothetical protein
MALISRLVGRLIWLCVPLLVGNLVLIPWTYKYYGMPMSEVATLSAMLFGAFAFIELLTRVMSRTHQYRESAALGPVTLHVTATSRPQLTAAYVVYTPIFLALSAILAWLLYQKMFLIKNGYSYAHPVQFVAVDCYAVFLIGQNLIAHFSKRSL